MVTAEQVQVVGGEVLSGGGSDWLGVGTEQRQLQRIDDGAGDFVLYVEDVVERAVVCI